jgi:DNA helicase-2/ATP-dependent DNA helicase PcrA
LGEGRHRFPKQQTIAAVYSRSVNAQETLAHVLEQRFPWCRDHLDALREVFVEYTSRKRAHNVLDFDDMLLYWRALMGSPAAGAVAAMFDHLLVDEYQDTNAVQADILEAMVAEHGNVTAVGDDAQAIYSFRAASAQNMADFPERFPGTTLVALEQNYRSTPQILATANAVIAESADVYPKELWSERRPGARPTLVVTQDETAEADWVCDRVLALREEGVPLIEQAVLFRTGHHSAVLELELARRDIPFVKFGGLRFLEAAHVKDLMALLRLLDNAEDVLAWHRVLTMLPGVGPATARRWIEITAGAGPAPRRVAALSSVVAVPEHATELVDALAAALADCAGNGGTEPSPASQIERLLTFCRAVFATKYADGAARIVDIEQLCEIAGGYPDRSAFLTELTLDPPNSTSDLAGPPHLDDDYLILSTIHSAKGAEWTAVTLLHAADGNIPSDMALGEPGGLEEERRLMYVALTRAKDHLAVTFPQRFYHRRFSTSHGAHSYAQPSRFLEPAQDHFETVTPDLREQGEDSSVSAAGVDPVAPMLEQLWA